MKAETKQSIKKLILSCLVIGALLGALYLVMYLLGWTDLSQEELQALITSQGAVAPLVFILISFLQVTFVPIPGAVTILAGNYVFGAGQSFLYSYIGMLLGAMFAFALGKWIGRPFVNWIAGGSDKVDEWLAKLKGRENVLLFFMFLLPFFPDDILCSVAGILPIGWIGFLIMQIITRLTSVGATLLLMSGEIIPWHGWGLVVLALIAVLAIAAFIISYRNAERINRFLERMSDKILSKLRRKKQ
ncbi:MAG: TVP38/TMEM64 family protein [Clostridia bacterium]|nr:TVP38/TMEM64 family protein [Clostridia bacterium]